MSLRAVRINANYTQEEVAKKLGVSPVTVINWENGKTQIKAVDLSRLCKLYNVPMSLIFLP